MRGEGLGLGLANLGLGLGLANLVAADDTVDRERMLLTAQRQLQIIGARCGGVGAGALRRGDDSSTQEGVRRRTP